MNARISWLQLAALLAISALFTETACLPHTDKYDMNRFLELAVSYGIVLILYIPLMLFYAKQPEGESALGVIAKKSKVLAWILGGVMLLKLVHTAILTAVQLEFYVTNTIMAYLSPIYFIILIFIAVFYGTNKGIQATARMAPVALFVFVLILVFISLASINKINFIRIYSPVIDGGSAFERYTVVIRNCEIVQFAILGGFVRRSAPKTGNPNGKKISAAKSVFLYLPFAFLISQWLTFVYNAVLGRVLPKTPYPLYTLASLAYLALFERMDGIDVTASAVMGLIKITVSFICVRIVIGELTQKQNANQENQNSLEKGKKAGKLTAGILILVSATTAFFLVPKREWLVRESLDLYFEIELFITAIVLPIFAFIFKNAKDKNVNDKNVKGGSRNAPKKA